LEHFQHRMRSKELAKHFEPLVGHIIISLHIGLEELLVVHKIRIIEVISIHKHSIRANFARIKELVEIDLRIRMIMATLMIYN